MSKKKIIGLIVIIVIIASVVLVAVVPGPRGLRPSGDAVAVVELAGPIQASPSGSLLGGGAITPDLVRDRLESAEDSPAVKAVVLRIDSPGGTVAASQEIAALVRDLSIPVVVSMGDMVASGGYYISAPADAIVAQPGTLTGSIGVIWSSFDPTGLFRELGIEIDSVTAGKHKDMFLPGRLTRPRRRIVQRMVNVMYDQFVSAVAQGRDLPEAQVRRLATGQLYTGTQARRSGLVDELGGLDDAVRRAEDLAGIDDARVVELTPSLFEQLFGAQPAAGWLQLPWDAADPTSMKTMLLRELLTNYIAPRYGGH
jgi:protease IV